MAQKPPDFKGIIPPLQCNDTEARGFQPRMGGGKAWSAEHCSAWKS